MVNSSWIWTHTDTYKMAYLIIVSHEKDRLEAVRLPYYLSVLAEAIGYIVNIGTKNRQTSVIGYLNPKLNW